MTGFIKHVSKVSKQFLPCALFLSLGGRGFAWIYRSWVFYLRTYICLADKLSLRVYVSVRGTRTQLWGSSSQRWGCEGRKAWGRVGAGGAWLSSPSCCAQSFPLSSPGFIHCSSPSAQGTGRKFPLCAGGDLPEHTES